MAKKVKQKKKPEQAPGKKGKSTAIWIMGAISVALLIMVVTGNIPFINSGGKKTKSFLVKGGEMRPVLDPSIFTGMTRSAYAAARKYPEVLDQVYCYCYCDEPPFYHKSLLSCFVENHGAG